MKDAAFSAMNRAIIRYIQASIPKDTNRAFTGIVSGKKVIVGNRSYRFDPTVDMYFGNGSRVACLLPDSGTTAAVVGVY